MIEGRALSRDEIKGLWQIDRSEVIEALYYFTDKALVLKPEHYDVTGWPPGEAEKYTPLLEACYDHGGWFYGLFDDQKLLGAAVLESRFIGKSKDQLQLKFLHISNRFRGNGWGKQLFNLAADEARRRGAKGLYISATPSERTINFYLRLGCQVVSEPDPGLWALEPEDIHLEYELGPNRP
jgi:predicted N-acetyltransferase YhbS